MILVSVGTQDKKFPRMLKLIEKEIEKGNIREKVIVQTGLTKYESEKMEIFDFIEQEKFNKFLKECNLLITHGGIGTIVAALKLDKKVIIIPRLKKYKEHVNNHQLEITKKYEEDGYILACYDNDNLGEVLEKIKIFKPKKYISNKKNFVNKLEEYIINDFKETKGKKNR